MHGKIRVGLYGSNGHQLQAILKGHSQAEITAYAGLELPTDHPVDETVTRHDSLQSLAADPRVDLISLCSPRRCDQVEDAILCLQSGKHVYAEKPCALNEADLDRVLATAHHCGKHFREMAGSDVGDPLPQLREAVRNGSLGTIVQVLTQKSYPYHDGRPQDELVDGGLVLQVGIHAVRFVEHVACMRIRSLDLLETNLGNPVPGDLRIAASLQGRLENGGLVSIVLNYLNPRGIGFWGNDQIRIFGTAGMIESVDGGTRASVALGEAPLRVLEAKPSLPDHATQYFISLLENKPMAMSLDDELHPLRVLLAVKNFPSAT
jgi:predicted dehydrogenase